MKTLVIVYRSFFVGGIETNMADVMESALKNGLRVIWICNSPVKYSDVFKTVIEHPNCMIVPINFSSINPFGVPNIPIEKGEELYVLVFDVFKLYFAYKLRARYKNNIVKIFYIVPNFTGETLFPDSSFSGYIKKIVNKKFANIYKIAYEGNNLHFFATRFYKEIQDNYNIFFKEPDKFLLKYINPRVEFSEDHIRRVYKSDYFSIITAGRFDFPHKAYLLGLIDSFSILKKKYKKMRLLIYGAGDGEEQVRSRVDNLPEAVKKDIIIHSPIPPNDLINVMRTCHLNISVAGCASMGARAGVITLPARHYYDKCEVYGFFPDAKLLTTESKPGFPVEGYIEKVLHMSEEEYVKYSKLAYHSFDEDAAQENYPFDFSCDISYLPRITDFLFVFGVYCYLRLKYLIKRLLKI